MLETGSKPHNLPGILSAQLFWPTCISVSC